MEYEQLGDEEYQRRRPPPFPVKNLAAITKLLTSCGVQINQAAAAAAAFHETFGQAGTDEEEDLKKLELLVKQYLHELEQESHRSTILEGASTSTSHSGGSGFLQKQVPADTELQILEQEEEVDVPPKLQAFVCFQRSGYREFYSPERLMFSNVVDDLVCMEAEKSFFLEGVIKRQINHITSQFAAMRTDLRNAYTKRAEVADIEWLKGVTDAAIETEILINDLIVKMACHDNSKKITKLKLMKARRVAIKKLKRMRSILNSPGGSLTQYDHPPRHDHIVSREKDVKLIQKHLMSKEKRVQVISVVGMLGIGKTALAHQIYSQYSVVCRFDVFTWAQYGREGSRYLEDTWSEVLEKAFREKVIDHQMHQLKREMDDQIITRGSSIGTTTWNHYTILHDLMILDVLRNHKYLIVIDDITTTEAWDEVRKALPMDTMNGSRILLTTRHTNVALHAIHHQPGSPPPHQLRPLSDAESWELFTMKQVRSNPSPLPLDLVLIGKQIVKQCLGLPFAIEHLADHLSTKETTYDAWFDVLQISNKQLDNCHTPWSYILNMTVEDLSLNLKWCLFYFVLFPKGYAIPVRRLIALWVAEGFIEQKTNKTLECIAEKYLQELIDLNMVQVTKQKSNGRPKRCCLANYLREHLSTKAMRRANFASSTSESSTSRSTNLWVRRLADHPEVNTSALPAASPDSYRLLLSFLSFDYREGYEPGERIRLFFNGGINKGHFRFLRILDLEGIYKPRLPKEMEKLVHLTYLGLRWTYLASFPLFIGNLINLQTLDVKHTYISTLPGSIWKLQKLRHVYLNECYLDSCFVHQPLTHNLDNLQTLWGVHVDEESSVLAGLDRVRNITRLGVSCHLTSKTQQDAMAKWISKLDVLQSLRFISKDRLGKLHDVHLLPFTTHLHLSELYFLGQLEKLFEVNAFPPNLTELTLSASRLKEDPMPTLETLLHLRILKLYGDSYIGEHMVCSSLGFIRLEVLQIWKLETVKTWIVEEKSMPMLKKLEIRSCNNLERLPVGLHRITTLQELKVTEMPMKFIDEVKKDQEKGWYKKVDQCMFC